MWYPGGEEGLGTDKIGWSGEVLNVQDGHTVLRISPDAGTDRTALGLLGRPETVTIGPNYFEVEDTIGVSDSSSGGGHGVQVACSRSDTNDAGATCTSSFGSSISSLLYCQTAYAITRGTTALVPITHSYPARGSYKAGVEKFTRTIMQTPITTPIPSWCTANATATGTSNGTATADTATITPLTLSKEEIWTYYLTITKGLEKLPESATQNRAAHMPVKTMGPVVAGLAVAAALVV